MDNSLQQEELYNQELEKGVEIVMTQYAPFFYSDSATLETLRVRDLREQELCKKAFQVWNTLASGKDIDYPFQTKRMIFPTSELLNEVFQVEAHQIMNWKERGVCMNVYSMQNQTTHKYLVNQPCYIVNFQYLDLPDYAVGLRPEYFMSPGLNAASILESNRLSLYMPSIQNLEDNFKPDSVEYKSGVDNLVAGIFVNGNGLEPFAKFKRKQVGGTRSVQIEGTTIWEIEVDLVASLGNIMNHMDKKGDREDFIELLFRARQLTSIIKSGKKRLEVEVVLLKTIYINEQTHLVFGVREGEGDKKEDKAKVKQSIRIPEWLRPGKKLLPES